MQSIIRCPQCEHRTEEKMPADACLYFYDCPTCGAKLRPKIGDLLCLLQLRIDPVPTHSGERKQVMVP